MKKALNLFLNAVIVIGIIVIIVCVFQLFHKGATGTNIKVYSTDAATVYFYPVCPECDHVSGMYSTNLSDGESHSTIHVCEKCCYPYEVTIKR